MTEPTANSAFSFVDAEHEVLGFWERESIFARTLKNTEGGKPYIFYDGPPFATGLPHHGHIVASTIKDIVPRYWTMRGHHVLRRFGWDCHGLPIEHEIDKKLNMSAQQAVAELGVAGYNNQCRAIVQRYVSEWRTTITRLGRWVDFDNDYKTMDPWFMESVWWVVRQLWDKGLIYRGVKVMPVSTALATPLSNFEATSNYMDVQDPAITVLLKLEDEDASLAIWTTTPWTLPSNLAVCVGPDIEYARVRDAERGVRFYIATARLTDYPGLEVEATCAGRDLVGRRYEPLFPYFSEEAQRGAFVVVMDDYVTTESGTGLVHQAPAFGEDDYRIVQGAGIEAFVCPVTLEGKFTDDVPDFAGRYVKEADADIIRALKATGVLYRHDTINHSYPFCYRSDTPLIYRAIPSWYVRVTALRDRLLAANAGIHWVPDHLRDGRFGNWLQNAIDWAISRNRVWGTPIPIWVNDVTGSECCVGSLDELEELTGVRVEDMHREHVDPLTFTRPGEEGVYRRVPEVLDCWFESGSMPYAQLHYPFENASLFADGFPAEFIAEGLDQTRGWFYTLTVLSVALFDKPAFRNVIVNGMVLAEDGKKMSKRLRNYTPPDELMERYGADALRLYLITSGLVKAEEQRFSDNGVRDMVRRVLLPWYNAYAFLRTYVEIDGWTPDASGAGAGNILDRWILSRLQTLKAGVREEMEGYRLYAVVPQLLDFIEDLTNWYIRLNRARFWEAGLSADKQSAFATLYTVLVELSRIMAPFSPFLSDYLYRQLTGLVKAPDAEASVHLCTYPEADSTAREPALERAVGLMQQVVLLGRQKREAERINLRTPLARLTVVGEAGAALADIPELAETIKRELNVQSVGFERDEGAYIELVAKPNFPVLGKRLGKRMKAFQQQITALDMAAIRGLRETGMVEIGGESFSREEIDVLQKPKPGANILSNSVVGIDLDCRLTETLIRGGQAREITRAVQQARKDSGLHVADRIRLRYHADASIQRVLEEHLATICKETLAVDATADAEVRGFTVDLDGGRFEFALERAAVV
ncbi:MAG: isoleucine--tRNA ligase [Pseudomonadales bacterium]|nr:isoleucine--tRNA ligase [Pseudomonadales bacterium]MCP5185892.1 isoleucine--tRNA ligase [Pseudomonadales bacterium]